MELALDYEPAGDPLLDFAAYRRGILAASERFAGDDSYGAAIALAKATINSVIDSAGADVEVLCSCSWGKDSSALVGLLAEVMLDRKSDGLPIPAIFLVVADTGGEFIEMTQRVREENAAFEKWAKLEGFKVQTAITTPKPKNHLLAEFIGAGRPLPTYQKANKAKSSNWCVQRLKIGPIEAALNLAKGRGKRMLHFLGVRSEESTRRALSIENHSQGLPFGLTRVNRKASGGDDVDDGRMGVQPIVHWSHEHLTQFLRLNMAPWNAFSYESLKAIYKRGAAAEDINGAGECRIAFTKDGGVSNVCSDLSGSRFGCLLCACSVNRSLINFAQKDRRYLWVNRVHKYIVGGMKLHRRRLIDFKAHGWDNTTMFPKNQTFEWRYRLAVLVYRAELESGFELMAPEVVSAIESWWERSGVFTVRMSDAKADALAWKNSTTGSLKFRWKAASANYESLSVSLSEGVPGGVYAHLRNTENEIEPISRVNLMMMAGRGNSFFPQLKAYVFRDTDRGGFVTVLTDTPSDIGRRMNTDCMSGIELFNLELFGVRDLTRWERTLMRGRNIYYRHTSEGLAGTIAKMTGHEWNGSNAPLYSAAGDLQGVLLANHEFAHPCGEKAYSNYLDEMHFIHTLRGKLTFPVLKKLMAIVTEATELSEILSEKHESKRRFIMGIFREELSRLRGDQFGGDVDARTLITKLVAKGWDMKQSLLEFNRYIELMREINHLIAAGEANTELVNRLSTIIRHSWFDPEYAQKSLIEVLAALNISAEAKAA